MPEAAGEDQVPDGIGQAPEEEVLPAATALPDGDMDQAAWECLDLVVVEAVGVGQLPSSFGEAVTVWRLVS